MNRDDIRIYLLDVMGNHCQDLIGANFNHQLNLGHFDVKYLISFPTDKVFRLIAERNSHPVDIWISFVQYVNKKFITDNISKDFVYYRYAFKVLSNLEVIRRVHEHTRKKEIVG
jgi:hypothetical protein